MTWSDTERPEDLRNSDISEFSNNFSDNSGSSDISDNSGSSDM